MNTTVVPGATVVSAGVKVKFAIPIVTVLANAPLENISPKFLFAIAQ
jgi:hypothetical protein